MHEQKAFYNLSTENRWSCGVAAGLTYGEGNTMKRRRLITFDWALKRLLRSKANFDV
ncbi:MAG: hypothetical protein HQL76_09965, partial [Magnetococcales bacterium]|nr:hypothetical protein [Magnetococcales bacterium]